MRPQAPSTRQTRKRLFRKRDGAWWVNAQYVARVRGKGDGAVCEMSNGLEVPVSRRRKAEMLARFGNSASFNSAAIAIASPLPGSDQNIRRKPN